MRPQVAQTISFGEVSKKFLSVSPEFVVPRIVVLVGLEYPKDAILDPYVIPVQLDLLRCVRKSQEHGEPYVAIGD
jgi:hypothetical protein